MRVREIKLREVRMKKTGGSIPETSAKRTAPAGSFSWKPMWTAPLLGECVAGETPSYSPETTDTAWHILRDHVWATFKGREFGRPAEVWDLSARTPATTWRRLLSKLPSGKAEQTKNPCRFLNCLAERAKKSLAASPSASKIPLDELVAAVKKELGGRLPADAEDPAGRIRIMHV